MLTFSYEAAPGRPRLLKLSCWRAKVRNLIETIRPLHVRKHYHPDLYPPSCFDDDLCLKPPILLWLGTLFLCRGLELPAVIGIGHVASVNTDAMSVMRGLWRADDLLPALLAAPVLYALVRRVPAASRLVRRLWAHGRELLALSAGADLALSVLSLRGFTDLGDQGPLMIGACIADLYFLLYVVAARRCRDTFADFPPPAASA